ncbi:hypothetical protein NOCARDAX2BIS_560008 [Nocardioides sp. AX2bis]|nr:hypothetical protein NOCARDAX2BIS_560008 [Nocardioides sp. AX2bis]
MPGRGQDPRHAFGAAPGAELSSPLAFAGLPLKAGSARADHLMRVSGPPAVHLDDGAGDDDDDLHGGDGPDRAAPQGHPRDGAARRGRPRAGLPRPRRGRRDGRARPAAGPVAGSRLGRAGRPRRPDRPGRPAPRPRRPVEEGRAGEGWSRASS